MSLLQMLIVKLCYVKYISKTPNIIIKYGELFPIHINKSKKLVMQMVFRKLKQTYRCKPTRTSASTNTI